MEFPTLHFRGEIVPRWMGPSPCKGKAPGLFDPALARPTLSRKFASLPQWKFY